MKLWHIVLIRERRELMRRLPEIQPFDRLAEIYRAQCGNHDAQRDVTIGEAERYEPAGTFEEFLRVNRLPVYERIIR